MHYYDLELLYKEYLILNNQYFSAKTSFKNASIYSEVENYDKMIQFIRSNIDSKIENINLHSLNSRTKRGLFNGIGTLLKGLTGNLDANDGERINKILSHMKSNQMKLQEQIKLQYSVNLDIVKKFNDTLRDIQHNELTLKSKIIYNEFLIQKNAKHENILFARDIFNQLIILYNTIFHILEEIENSLTFCKLRTLHPSIIKPKDLFLELQRISEHYKNQFPYDVEYKNIFDFESVIEIHCKVENNRINYLLSIPIDFDILFDLYYLLPIPTKRESEYFTIIPDSKYILKSKNNLLKPLSDRCTEGKIFHCPSYLQISSKTDCEKQILSEERTNQCRYDRLQVVESHMEIIPEIDHYLAVFPTEQKLKIKCQEKIESRTLSGIFLIKGSSCEVLYNNQKLNFLDKTYGKPLVMDKLPLDFKETNISNYKIHLKTLKLAEVPKNLVLPINEDDFEDYYKPSAWTVILYICLVVSAIFAYYRWKTKRAKKTENIADHIELSDIKNIGLPEVAKF